MENGKTIAAKRAAFAIWLKEEEKSDGTVEKYLRDIGALAGWLDGCELTKETAMAWKDHLVSREYAPTTVNSMHLRNKSPFPRIN